MADRRLDAANARVGKLADSLQALGLTDNAADDAAMAWSIDPRYLP